MKAFLRHLRANIHLLGVLIGVMCQLFFCSCTGHSYHLADGPLVLSEVELDHDDLSRTYHWAMTAASLSHPGATPWVDCIRVWAGRMPCGHHGLARGCRWQGGLIEISMEADYPEQVLAHELLHSVSTGHPGPAWDRLQEIMASMPWRGDRLAEKR